MGKLTDMFSKVSFQVKETFSKFPITIILVYILTVFWTIFLDSEIIGTDILEKVVFVGGVSLLGVLLVESNKEKIKASTQKNGIVLAFAIAIIFYMLLDSSIENMSFLLRCFGTYVISTSVLIIYSLVKNSGVEFKEYVLKAFSSVFKFTIVYGILNIGILLLSLAFIELILDGTGWSLVGRALMLLLGFFYIPVILHSISEMKVEVSKFVRGLVLYVLLPLVTIGMVIIYMYIVKIAVNEELPKNSIFAMLAAIFVFLYPVAIMARNYKDESKSIDKISKVLMYLYIPFIILEIYAIGIRTNAYGLTPMRYLAYVFIVFQIIFIFMTLFKKSKYIKESMLVIIPLTCIVLVTPFNFERMSNLSQKKILEKYIENGIDFEKCSDEEKSKYAGAYQYLSGVYDEYIPDLSESEKEKMSSFNNIYLNEGYYLDYEENESLYYANELDDLDISEYSRIYEINRYYKTSNDYESYEIKAGNIILNANIEEYANKLIDANRKSDFNGNVFFTENSILETEDENFDVYVMYINIEYNPEDDEIKDIILGGYVLKK